MTPPKIRGGGVIAYNLPAYLPLWVKKRLELKLAFDDIVLISAGRLDANKNNETTIRGIARVPDVKLLLCGDGEQKQALQALAEKLGVADRVYFLGNRTDIAELYQAADLFVMMSFREGLSRSLMEAMASGLPCVASKIRGNVDLLEDGVGGYLCDPTDVDAFAGCIRKLAADRELREKQRAFNLERIKNFSVSVVKEKIEEIYSHTIK